MQEKLSKVQTAYNQIKEQLDGNIARYESLLMKVKDNEDDKDKYIMHAKKLDEQLKTFNNNYVNLQKKVSSLEEKNKDLTEQLRVTENERKNISEKWLALSKKTKSDREVRSSIRDLEQQISIRGSEADEFRERFA